MKSRIPVRLGLISALHEEQKGLIESMHCRETHSLGMRDYVCGRLWGVDSICVLSRIGKVAAATTAAMLIERFKVTHVIFTGVAGSADASVRVGDIVVADNLVQHDMDASPLFPRFEVPLTGISMFASNTELSGVVAAAAHAFTGIDFPHSIIAEDRMMFGLQAPQVYQGTIGSGDEFITCKDRLSGLKAALPPLLAVEMEGAAVAQVCYEFGLPFAVIRTISDGADESAAHDFLRFVDKVASRYSFDIMHRVCLALHELN